MKTSIASSRVESTPAHLRFIQAIIEMDRLLHSQRRTRRQEREVQEYLRDSGAIAPAKRAAKHQVVRRTARVRSRHTQRRAASSNSGGGEPDPDPEPDLTPQRSRWEREELEQEEADHLLGKGARSARIRARHKNKHISLDEVDPASIGGQTLADAVAERERKRRVAVEIERAGWAAICAVYYGPDRDVAILSAQIGPDQTKEIAKRIGRSERLARIAQERVFSWVQKHTNAGALHDATDADPDLIFERVEKRPPTRRGRKPKWAGFPRPHGLVTIDMSDGDVDIVLDDGSDFPQMTVMCRKEVAGRALGVSTQILDSWVRSGRISPMRAIDGVLGWTLDEVAGWRAGGAE